MKRLLLALPLLLLISTSVGETTPTLGVTEGDSFEFVLEKYNFEYDGQSETTAELEDEFDDDTLTLSQGDTFTITILNATPSKTEWGDPQLLVEYSANGQTIQYYEWIEFGGFITYTNWDELKSEFESNTETDEMSSTSLIDTEDEFGMIYSYSYSYSDTDGQETETGTREIRYDRDTGVINYISIHFDEEDVSSGVTETSFSDAVIRRVGYSPGGQDTGAGLALPAMQFYAILPILGVLVLINKRK